MDPLKAQTVDTYNASAETIAAKFDQMGSRIADVRKAFSYVTAEKPRVVEIGCGNGRDAEAVLQCTDSYVGFDISEKMIALARAKVPHATFEVADTETYAFPKGPDVVLFFASLLHSPKEAVRSILANVRESLTDGGIILLSLKEADAYREETVEETIGTRTFYLYTPAVIQEAAGDGYETVHESHQDKGRWKWFTLILRKKRSQ